MGHVFALISCSRNAKKYNDVMSPVRNLGISQIVVQNGQAIDKHGMTGS